MASADTLCKKLLNVKNIVVETQYFFVDQDGVTHLRICARSNKWHKNECPICGRRCVGYDQPALFPKIWHGLDFGGVLVEIEAFTHRINCPKHGIKTVAVPWAYSNSRFTPDCIRCVDHFHVVEWAMEALNSV